MRIQPKHLVLVLCGLICQASAQSYNLNFGAGPGFPLSTTSDFANVSYNLVVGGGPNLTRHLKMNAEFMFHGVPVSQTIIDETGLSNVKGRLYSLTGNVILGTSIGGSKNAYLIGGGGWYRRTLEGKQKMLQAGTKCAPVWTWWNVECVDGVFATDVTVGSRISSAPGFNIGGGLCFRLGDSSANIYTEVRYHRAFTANIATTVLPLTFGVRW